jgi:hypothetical protein
MSTHDHAADCHICDLIRVCRSVPHLDAFVDEGEICLVLDGRLGLALSETEACAVIPFIAACIETAAKGPLNNGPAT